MFWVDTFSTKFPNRVFSKEPEVSPKKSHTPDAPR